MSKARKKISKKSISVKKKCYIISCNKYAKLIKINKREINKKQICTVQLAGTTSEDIYYVEDVIMPGKPMRMFELNKKYI